MKRKILCLALLICMASVLAVPAFAEEFSTQQWSVSYSSDKGMEENFPESIDLASDMQPGDNLTQTIKLTNNSDKTTNWYISNEVLESLEDNSQASGGAYSYVLSYDDGKEKRDLFNSALLGGDDENALGLGLATQGLEDYVFLGELPAGGEAEVSLAIGLDGMSQINTYQNTSASVRVNFAVEEARDATRTTVTTSVKTGDWMETLPFIMLTAVSGLLLLGIAVVSLRKSKRN